MLNLSQNLCLKRMGVINITPNSFSDGGEVTSVEKLKNKIAIFSKFEAIDVGAESTAPMNASITWEEEWNRIEPYLLVLLDLNIPLSIDTYHAETIEKIFKLWMDNKKDTPLIWNDISGKYDEYVKEFLKINKNFSYVFCHNFASSRENSGNHMHYVRGGATDDYLEELCDYFSPFRQPQVIFDPGFGFSKTYEQNWYILENFRKLQKIVSHDQWLIGISRKSFLKKKLSITDMNNTNREKLDLYHQDLLRPLLKTLAGTVWIRTHRPELV